MSWRPGRVRRTAPNVWWACAGVVALLIFVVVLAPSWLVSGSDLTSVERFKAMADIRTGVVAALVMAAGIGGLSYTARTFRLSQLTHLTGRFESAARQLGEDDPATRVGGVYALAQLADVWLEQRQACIDVLCVAARAQVPGGPSVQAEILALLSNRLQPDAPVVWDGCIFDLSRATINDADFSGIHMTKGSLLFDHATVVNRLDFTESCFDGGRVSFKKVTVEVNGRLVFRNADLAEGTVSFDGMTLVGNLDLGARLGAAARTRRPAQSHRRGFRAAIGSDASRADGEPGPQSDRTGLTFDDATIRGTLSFDEAVVGEDVSLRRCILTHARVTFRGAALESGKVTFDGATSVGAKILVDEDTKSSGGRIYVPRSHGPEIVGDQAPGLFVDR